MPPEPNFPRPPQPNIDAVYPDLANVLSGQSRDSLGRHSMTVDDVTNTLLTLKHSRAATEWAIYDAVERELIVETVCKRDLRKSDPRRGITEATPNLVDVPAVAATDELWEAWKSDDFTPRIKQAIILIHGIRTHANWQPMVQRVLEEIPKTTVVPIKFVEWFDAFRFWCPFFTRNAPIQDVRRQIQVTKEHHPDAEISVVAHSFGTYIISKILLDVPDLKFHRVVFAGSIVPRSYRWEHVKSQVRTEVINDYGTRDIWPVLAKALTAR